MDNKYLDLAKTLQAVIDTAIDGILTIDVQGRIETVNKAAAALFGYNPDELIGNNIKMLMPQPYRSEHDQYIHNYVVTKKPKIIGIGREVTGVKKDGTMFPMRLAVGEAILNDRIIFTGIVHDLTDVHQAKSEILALNKELEKKVSDRTYQLEQVVNQLLKTNKDLESEILERVNTQEKLKEKGELLEEALQTERDLNELKSRFISMASHEFRTPLATVLSSVSLIQRYENSEQQVNRLKHIDRIKSAVTHLTTILNDFLSLSKLEEGKIVLSLQEISLPNLVNEAIESLKGVAKPNQEIILRIIGIEKPIFSDLQVLKNILFNLLSNAIKYSNSEIVFELKFEAEVVILTIIDSGIGIPESDQKHLFGRFFRAGNVTNIEGTGLGLHIVKQYIDMLKGSISFHSIYNHGTTFEITIPTNTTING